MENLLKNQEAAKVKKLMSEVYKSSDKEKFFKKLFDEKRVLFQSVDQEEMIEALLEREEPDPDVERFVNIQEPTKRNQTALHLAVNKRCFASASALLKAGSYQLKPDEDSFTPDLESLFNLSE